METERVVECFSAAVGECIEAESDMHVSEKCSDICANTGDVKRVLPCQF